MWKILRRLRHEAGQERREEPTHEDAVRRSGLFDPAFYLETNPDVAQAGIDPVRHYVEHGWREGRTPAAWYAQYASSNIRPGSSMWERSLQHLIEIRADAAVSDPPKEKFSKTDPEGRQRKPDDVSTRCTSLGTREDSDPARGGLTYDRAMQFIRLHGAGR